VHPKFCKPRLVLYSLKEAIEQDLNWLEKLGITPPVTSLPASPPKAQFP